MVLVNFMVSQWYFFFVVNMFEIDDDVLVNFRWDDIKIMYLVGTFVHRASCEHWADPVRIIPHMLDRHQAYPV